MPLLLFIAVVSFTSLAFYIVLIWNYLYGLKRLKREDRLWMNHHIKVSVVIAIRDEEMNVSALCESLMAQTYPSKLTEFILIDDHSEDKTRSVLKKIAGKDKRFHIVTLNDDQKGKKAALRKGVETASGEFILSTDADCRLPETWISEYVAFYAKHKPKLILGPVKIVGMGFFSAMQQLEMLSLMGTTAGSAGIGRPVMSNAANMGFVKQVFAETDLKTGVPTGDDVFLLEHIKKRFPDKIDFLFSEKAIVETSSSDAKQFFHQRLRWASKSRYFSSPDIQYAGWIVALTNGLLVLCFLLSIKWSWAFMIFVTGLVLKSIPDYLLLRRTAIFFGQRNVLKLFFPVQMIYPFYAVTFVFLGLTMPYRWKGRTY